MAEPSEDALVGAVNALYRIRAVEGPPGDDGLRSVWHQCAQGADLVSYVDEKGHVVRQELTLLDDYFKWTSAAGLTTGETHERSGKVAMKPSSDVALDGQIVPQRVLRASSALASYKGDDKYIRNIQRVLGMVAMGLQSYDEVTVTRSVKAPTATLPRPAGAPPPKATIPRAALVAGVLIAIVLALGLLMLRS